MQIQTLQVCSLRKRYGARVILDDVSFTAPGSRITGLIGANGAGKTTLLECLSGLLDSSGGHVLINGYAPNATAGQSAMLYMPESVRPWPAQRVGWVLRYMSSILGARGELARACAGLRIEPLLGTAMRDLSKGEHRRVLLALALAHPAPLLLLDEPFDGLDLRQTRDAMSLLREQAAAGRTLLVSMHQLDEASRLCNHVVLLDHGRVVGQGSIDELRQRMSAPTASLEEIVLALA